MRSSRRFGHSLPNVLAVLALVSLGSIAASTALHAANWSRFRGENGSGVSADSAPVPTEWSETKNLKWSVDLPGLGVSCPIVVGDRVYVTCWTGDGPENLKRHLQCYDRASGDLKWSKEVAPAAPDEPNRGMFQQTGYTAHTPVSDGERIYCFFGVTGVLAFDLDGNVVWGPVSVGTGFDNRGWGTASSPVLYKNLVIITAAPESHSMVALDKTDGHEVWKQEADGLSGLWGTPVLMDTEGGTQELVLAVPGELWGVNPDSGKLRWHAATGNGDSMCSSAIVADGIAYVVGERGAQTVAIRGGGEGDVSESHLVWNSGEFTGRIGSPVIDQGLLYWVANGELNCVDAKTGERVYKEALKAPEADPAVTPAAAQLPAQGDAGGQPGGAPPQAGDGGQGPGAGGPGGGGGPGGRGGRGGGRGGRGGGRGGMMSSDYASPIIADGKLYFTRRNGDVYVVQAGREFKQLAVNKFDAQGADFSSTPAVSDGQLFIRSSKKLYCVAAE
jgi:outer membrane protein assembly factor BamB